MKKSDLKNGAIVETREKSKCILLKDTNVSGEMESLLIDIKNGDYLEFDNYNEDLTNCNNSYFDIMKVSQREYIGDTFRNHILKTNEDNWTWEREEKEEEIVMTISEIEEKLGIKGLKIKKED